MTKESEYRYKAFISYSHSDEKWARWLHRALESYRVPKRLVGQQTRMGRIPSRLAPVFRDREELASSTDLGSDLRAALEGSRCQIVICSPASAKSHWVNEEILAFKRLGRSDRIFSLIVDGEPYASGIPGEEDQECFPHALRYQMDEAGELTDTPAEPIAADVRPGKDGRNHAKIKLFAGLLGVGFDALRQREQQRRNRRLAAVAAFSTVGMVVALGLATAAVIARNEAQRQRLRAESEAETARQTASFMVSLFRVSDPSEARGRSITAREILTAGAERIETELAAQPAIQTRLMNTIGNVFISLGLYGDARDMLSAALARRRALAGIEDEAMARSLAGLAEVLTETADFSQAEALYLESIERLESSGAGASDEMDNSLAGLAELYFRLGRFADAEPLLVQVLENRRQRLGPRDPAVADAIEEIGLNAFDQGDLEAAEARLREALALRREILGDEPHPDIAENLNNLALVQEVLERYNAAEGLYLEAMAMNRRLHGEQHPDIATGLNNLGYLYRSQGRLREAEEAYQQALAMRRDLLGERHPKIAQVLVNLSLSAYDQNELNRAIGFSREALDIQREAYGEQHPEVAATLSMLGRFLAEDGQRDAGEVALRQAMALYDAGLLDSEHPDVALAEMGLADLLAETEHLDEALTLAEAGQEKLAAAYGDDHWLTRVTASVRGGVLSRLTRYGEAEALLLDSYRFLAASDSARPPYVARARERVVAHYVRAGDPDRAASYRRDASGASDRARSSGR